MINDSFSEELLKVKLAVLDTSCFVYFLEGRSPFNHLVIELLKRHERKDLQCKTSTISVIETLIKPIKVNNKMSYQVGVSFFSSLPRLEVLPVSFELSLIAANIRAKYNIKTPDSIQLSVAVQEKADVFITNDRNLKSFKEVKVLVLKDFV